MAKDYSPPSDSIILCCSLVLCLYCLLLAGCRLKKPPFNILVAHVALEFT